MPSRILREGIISSERVCSLSWAEEVFYRRLHSTVDDFGRFFAKPSLLRAACYPLQLDKVSDADIAKWLSASKAAGLVSVYQVGGKDYLEVLDFRQQVRAKHSKFPAPPADAQQMHSGCAASAPVVVGGFGFGDEGKASAPGAARQAPKNGHAISFDFGKGKFDGISEEETIRWQGAFPAIAIPVEIDKAAVWLAANPSNRKKNYARFLVNWFTRSQERAGRVPPPAARR